MYCFELGDIPKFNLIWNNDGMNEPFHTVIRQKVYNFGWHINFLVYMLHDSDILCSYLCTDL